MISKSDIKFLRSLREKKFRDESGLFLVEGEKMVAEALAAPGWKVEAVHRMEDIGREAMERISLLNTPSPVLAVVRRRSLPEPESVPAGLWFALDSVRDPGNLGTIIRICDWWGIDTLFASPDTVELYNPKTVQATMGAIFRVKVVYTPLPCLIDMYGSAGVSVYATSLKGRPLDGAGLDRERALVIMGSESHGVSPEVLAKVESHLLIPPFPEGASTSESLNVAVATAVMAYEFRRKL